jgi:hypothetical protein
LAERASRGNETKKMVDEMHLEVVLFDKFWQIVSLIATLLSSETDNISTVPEFRGENDVCINSETVKQALCLHFD